MYITHIGDERGNRNQGYYYNDQQKVKGDNNFLGAHPTFIGTYKIYSYDNSCQQNFPGRFHGDGR